MGSLPASLRIVTDTTACLDEAFLQAHHVENVPQVILFGEDSYLEQVEISCEDFLQRLRTSPVLPCTAAPPPGEFVKAYRRQLGQAQTILSIHPSSEVSGTVRSAISAREESFPGADIRVLDTRTVAGPLASMVRMAVEWSESGVSADEIMRRLEAQIPRSRAYFAVGTLEYLRRGGRIGGASALLGSALQIKPVLQLRQGKVEPLEKVRTHRRALERLKALTVASCPPGGEGWLSVMHGDLPEEAAALAAELQQALGARHVPVYRLGAAISTHVGPETLAVGFFT
jgi:DegV family protein with EDD domain